MPGLNTVCYYDLLAVSAAACLRTIVFYAQMMTWLPGLLQRDVDVLSFFLETDFEMMVQHNDGSTQTLIGGIRCIFLCCCSGCDGGAPELDPRAAHHFALHAILSNRAVGAKRKHKASRVPRPRT